MEGNKKHDIEKIQQRILDCCLRKNTNKEVWEEIMYDMQQHLRLPLLEILNFDHDTTRDIPREKFELNPLILPIKSQ